MELELGYGDEIYGTVENKGNTLHYNGERKEVARSLIESMHPPTQDLDVWLASLPERLRGRVWAQIKE